MLRKWVPDVRTGETERTSTVCVVSRGMWVSVALRQCCELQHYIPVTLLYLLTYYNKDRASVRVRIGYRGRCLGKGGGQVSFILREIHWHFETDGYRRSHISASQSQLGHRRRRRDYAVICPLICPQPRTSAPWLGFKVIGNESVPIQLAQCWFPGLAASNAEIIYGSNFIKQHSETVMVWNYQNADAV